MTNSSSIDKRINKNFVINNRFKLKDYALKNREVFGQGIIVVNLLLLKANNTDESSLFDTLLETPEEATIQKPVSYIPKNNFWYKMLNLKIKKKYEIDIQAEDELGNKFLIVFVKDASIEHFSIYSLKLDNKKISST